MKIIRRILICVIGTVFLAALINYMIVTHRRSGEDGERPPMISADFRRAAEGVEVFVRKGSDLRFTVRARHLRETIQDLNLLEGIEASDFNRDGSVRNSIYSDRAVYDPDRKMLDFDGDIHVFLGDGVELRAEAMRYDLGSEVGVIPGNMEFVSNNVSGRARDVRFFRDEDRLELGGDADFSLTRENAGSEGAESAIRAVASRGTCLLAENRILFSGGVRMESPDMGALSADAVDIILNPDRSQITHMTASGEASYETRNPEGTRSVSGGRMVFTSGMTGALEKALISEHANLAVKSKDGEQSLRAGEIEMLLDSATGAISEIRGTNRAYFHGRRGADEALAEGDTIFAAFADAGVRLIDVRLSGRSRFALAGAENAANELRAEIIQARFRAESDDLENLTADGGARLVFKPSGADAARTLLASKLEIRFAAGNYPESGEASGAATFEETSAARTTRRIKAERIRFDFFPVAAQIKSLNAVNGVSAVYERASSSSGISGIERYQTFSDDLEVFFVLNNGTSEIRQAAQRGNFRFVSDGSSASAGQCEYDAAAGKLVMTGSPEILDAAGRVSGDRIEYDHVADELTVRGRVRAVLIANDGLLQAGLQTGGGDSPVVVTAEELHYRKPEEHFRFSGGVAALTENQQLGAREIAIDGGGNMTADGGVLHRIHEAGASAIIESGRMEYRRGEGVIRYSGKVGMKSGELTLSADTLNAALDDNAKDIRRVLAEGNVLVRHGGRVCRGDTAEWIPATAGYVVTGRPATFDDPDRGRSTARRLTYFQDEDRITLEP